MASTIEFVEFVCSQLSELGNVRHRKMFGEYLVYVNEKPAVLVCDEIAYIKKLPDANSFCAVPGDPAPESAVRY